MPFDHWIAVTEEEVVILANYFQDLSFLARDRHGRPLFAEGTFSMKIVEGKCCMLKDKKCSIYDRCPAVCRKFSVGGRQCKEVIRRTP